MLKKLTPQQISEFLGIGLRTAIANRREELERLEEAARSMANGKKPAAAKLEKPKRKISAKHKAALAQSMRRRWREAKKAGRTLNQTG